MHTLYRFLILSILLPCISLANAHIVKEDGGFYLTLDLSCIQPVNIGNFPTNTNVITGDGPRGDLRAYDQDRDFNQKEIGVLYSIYCYFSRIMAEQYDELGFYGGSSTYFMITGYPQDSEPKYIESISIKWSKYDRVVDHDGKLWIHARTDVPFDKTKTALDDISAGADEETFMSSKKADDNLTETYRFSKPVKYLAITREGKEANFRFVRIESFTIHFVDEDPTAGSQPVELLLNGGNTSLIQPWSKKDISLSNFVEIADDNESSIEDLGLEFYLTPDFVPNVKPDYAAERPADMADLEWKLYQLFENGDNSQNYDGFIGDVLNEEGRIPCPFDPSANTLSIPVPCSGSYTLSVESKVANVKAEDMHLNIYPEITHTYSVMEMDEEEKMVTNSYEFTLNNIRFGGDLTPGGKLQYPFADSKDPASGAYGADAVTIFIPGLFDAKVYYKVDYEGLPEESDPDDMRIRGRKSAEDSDGFVLYSNANKLDLSGLNGDNLAIMQIKIEKNGAVTPMEEETGNSVHTFSINLNSNIETGVESISLDTTDAQPRYYNLNGLEVNPANLTQGIYIVVRKGAAPQKIIIR